MADDTKTNTENQTSNNVPAAPGGNPDNVGTIQNMDTPELRNAVIELLTVIDDSDDMDVVVTVADDGSVSIEAVEAA